MDLRISPLWRVERTDAAEETSDLRTTRYLPGVVIRGAPNARGNKLSAERMDNMVNRWTGLVNWKKEGRKE